MEKINHTLKEFKKFSLDKIMRRVLCRKTAEGKFIPVTDGKDGTAIVTLEMDFSDFWSTAKVAQIEESAAAVAEVAEKKKMKKGAKKAPENITAKFVAK